MSSRQLCPGDLVFGIESGVPFGEGIKLKSGLVLAVAHSRTGAHMGCEDRLSVLWMNTLKIKHECDCGIAVPDDFYDLKQKSAASVKKL